MFDPGIFQEPGKSPVATAFFRAASWAAIISAFIFFSRDSRASSRFMSALICALRSSISPPAAGATNNARAVTHPRSAKPKRFVEFFIVHSFVRGQKDGKGTK